MELPRTKYSQEFRRESVKLFKQNKSKTKGSDSIGISGSGAMFFAFIAIYRVRPF